MSRTGTYLKMLTVYGLSLSIHSMHISNLGLTLRTILGP
jgi:hypothetical protein